MSLKILIVEDELPMLDSWKTYFEDEGYTVFGTGMGDEALRIVEREHPNVIICDLQLKDSPITGIEVLKQTYEKYPDIKVIVATGYDKDEKIRSICMQYRPYEFLGKPVSIDTLLEMLKKIEEEVK